MAVLVDTSVLIRVRDIADPNQPLCERVLSSPLARQLELRVCAQVLVEYWVVATRPPGKNGYGLSVDEAAADLDAYLARLPCLPEPPDVAARWMKLVHTFRVVGKPAHDARLVSLMEAHGIRRMLTLNARDFARYPQVECVTPAQLLAATKP